MTSLSLLPHTFTGLGIAPMPERACWEDVAEWESILLQFNLLWEEMGYFQSTEAACVGSGSS